MKRVCGTFVFGVVALLTLLFTQFPVCAYEFTSNIAFQTRLFPHAPAYTSQERNDASLAGEIELYHEFVSGSSFTIKPFARIDSADEERTHWDIREANYLYLAESWELLLGVSKVFWGATEFVHLVDIINQTDLIESLDGEEKLGQPMVYFSILKEWGAIDAFLLPWFRERTYPGVEGRLRTGLVIDTDRAQYESSAEQAHLDVALRYSQTFGEADVGVYHFIGTDRDPTLLLDLQGGQALLIPYYEQIQQTGLDIQMVAGNWLWKGEALYRSGKGRDFAATTFGFEYTFYGIGESQMDLGLLSEYVFDDRAPEFASPYNNDIMAGLRLAVNDASSTELLAGVIKDIELSSQLYSVEGSRRLGENWKLVLEAAFFVDIDRRDPAYGIRDDDRLKVELLYYF